MDFQDELAEQFQENRGRMRAVAYRMLGSATDADDAVQETWLRLSRADAAGVQNLAGWLTTVVGRVCLDMLRTRKSRREDRPDGRDGRAAGEVPASGTSLAGTDSAAPGSDPESAALLADTVGAAMLVVLDTLAPAERLAFVLHDVFAVPFEEIAPIVDRSPAAARQLASRARRRVQGARAGGADHTAQRRVVEAFLAASREGNFADLLALLDPDVVLRADAAAVAGSKAAIAQGITGAPAMERLLRGPNAVATTFSGRAQAARPALADGAVSAVWAPGGTPRVVFEFTVAGGVVTAVDVISDPEILAEMEIELLG